METQYLEDTHLTGSNFWLRKHFERLGKPLLPAEDPFQQEVQSGAAGKTLLTQLSHQSCSKLFLNRSSNYYRNRMKKSNKMSKLLISKLKSEGNPSKNSKLLKKIFLKSKKNDFYYCILYIKDLFITYLIINFKQILIFGQV